MTKDSMACIANQPPESLLPIARHLLGEEVTSVADLQIDRIGRSVGPGTLGIYRVTGKASMAAGPQSWSAVVKVIGAPDGLNASTEVDPNREISVYRSGVFASLQRGVRAARCYTIQEKGDLQLLWLEDLSVAPQPPWNTHHYIETARHLGLFNGHWPEQALPEWDWLSRGGLFRKYRAAHHEAAFARLPVIQDHDLIRLGAPNGIHDLMQLWQDGHQLLEKATAAPKGICHLDCHARNLFPARDAKSEPCTVAIDWASVGIDSLGTDICTLLSSALRWLDLTPEEARSLRHPVFEAYMSGLREAGWSGDEAHVKFVFLACLGMEPIRNVWNMVNATDNPKFRAMVENALQRPVGGVYVQWNKAQPFFIECNRQALQLAATL